jgi:hypothetical protein
LLLIGKGEQNVRVYFDKKEVPTLIRALSLILREGSPDEVRIAEALLERITTCQERQGYKPRVKG